MYYSNLNDWACLAGDNVSTTYLNLGAYFGDIDRFKIYQDVLCVCVCVRACMCLCVCSVCGCTL